MERNRIALPGPFAAQVEVAVLQPRLLPRGLVELERQWRALAQHRQRRRVDLDVTGGDVGVGVALGAGLDDALDGDAELGPQPMRLFEDARLEASRNTTCATPDASRRSMKMTPPWSRRRATQPANVTFWPASVDRNEPAA